ncbi:malonic semialdehyde reductase [Cellulosimicrobium arenosum]|uniref:Malonic semialdehyde reductase n=1 Tax=Cellulosimicrobium arenosum TaxID=2708133 RepID=A0A927PGX6_9MICO|nr:malonic semialdehyde reductase [Cellulosimicrobium arenosum]MBD8080480.1 malonic semialdehyde reductase [Cellulosimicrobium arenosum]
MSTDTLAPALSVDDATADLLFREARTTREFTDAEVTDEQLAAVYDLVKWGPTAMNTLPLRVLAVRSPEARERLVAHMADGNKERVSTAPLSLVVAYDPAFHEHLDTLMPHLPGMRDNLHAVPAVREDMGRTNGLLQAGYLVVGLRAAGLAAGPMNGMDHAAVDAEFFAENGWRSLLVINVGVAAGTGTTYPRAPRLAAEQAVTTV